MRKLKESVIHKLKELRGKHILMTDPVAFVKARLKAEQLVLWNERLMDGRHVKEHVSQVHQRSKFPTGRDERSGLRRNQDYAAQVRFCYDKMEPLTDAVNEFRNAYGGWGEKPRESIHVIASPGELDDVVEAAGPKTRGRGGAAVARWRRSAASKRRQRETVALPAAEELATDVVSRAEVATSDSDATVWLRLEQKVIRGHPKYVMAGIYKPFRSGDHEEGIYLDTDTPVIGGVAIPRDAIVAWFIPAHGARLARTSSELGSLLQATVRINGRDIPLDSFGSAAASALPLQKGDKFGFFRVLEGGHRELAFDAGPSAEEDLLAANDLGVDLHLFAGGHESTAVLRDRGDSQRHPDGWSLPDLGARKPVRRGESARVAADGRVSRS